jgi:hypothetical protein
MDRAVEERALALQKPETTPIVAHLIATRSIKGEADGQGESRSLPG